MDERKYCGREVFSVFFFLGRKTDFRAEIIINWNWIAGRAPNHTPNSKEEKNRITTERHTQYHLSRKLHHNSAADKMLRGCERTENNTHDFFEYIVFRCGRNFSLAITFWLSFSVENRGDNENWIPTTTATPTSNTTDKSQRELFHAAHAIAKITLPNGKAHTIAIIEAAAVAAAALAVAVTE